MKSTFKCFACEKIFEAEGKKVDYMDPIYGACSRIISTCPTCELESSEYRKPRPVKVMRANNYGCGDCNSCGMN